MRKIFFPLLFLFLLVVLVFAQDIQVFWEDWEAGNFNQWTNTGWSIATDQKANGSNSAKCIESTECDMNSSQVDTSSVISVNVSFFYRDDDCDGGVNKDVELWINDSTGTWDLIDDIDAGTQGTSDHDWHLYEWSSTESQYKHSGFSVRFWANPANNENYWFDDLNISKSVAIDSPHIASVTVNATNFDPNEGGITTVKVDFVAYDKNSNLDHNTCKCEFDNADPWVSLYESANDNICDYTAINSTHVNYTCEVDMLFWYEPTLYTIHVEVEDTTNRVASHNTSSFTYNILLASDIDSSVIDFGSLSDNEFSTDVTDSNSPFVINNTGNQVIDLNVSGDDLADSGGFSDNVLVSNFFVDTDSDIAGATQLSYSSDSVSGASVPVATSGGDGLEQLWWFFSVPSALPFGTYTGLWTLDES